MITAKHPLHELTDEDYQLAAPIIETAAAIEQMISPHAFVLDLANNRLPYISPGFAKLFGSADGHTMASLERLVDDPSMLGRLKGCFHSAYRQDTNPLAAHTVLSVDGIAALNGLKIMMHLKIKPLAVDSQNAPWLLLGLLSPSAAATPSHIIGGTAKSLRRFLYVGDGAQGHWEPIPDIGLTKSELTMLSLSAQGLSVNQVAALMHKSVNSVKHYRKEAFRKMGVANIAQAIALVDDLCLI